MDNYIVFEIHGVSDNPGRKIAFSKDSEHEISNDEYITKITVSKDIKSVTFHLKNGLDYSDELISNIIKYLYDYLGSMMIALLKKSSSYISVQLKPTIRLQQVFINGTSKTDTEIFDRLSLHDELEITMVCHEESKLVNSWLQEVDTTGYKDKKDKYDILFLLLQGNNIVQKYMAMYAFLMSLVRELNSSPNEGQKQVVQYIKNNCSRVGISINLSPSTRPGAKPTDLEDQFTLLRNKIGHPTIDSTANSINVSINAVNELASIICCAIEDLPAGC